MTNPSPDTSTEQQGKDALTKAQIAFLRKVSDRGVFKSVSYRPRGSIRYFVGGEQMAIKMAALGLIELPYVPDIGRPSYATLTDAGRAALTKATTP